MTMHLEKTYLNINIGRRFSKIGISQRSIRFFNVVFIGPSW
jgi:hypothetical protein